MFEVFVEAVLASTLDRVANKRGTPAGEDPTETFRSVDQSPSLEVALVEVGSTWRRHLTRSSGVTAV
ncbi:hypothetical protein PHISCL_11198 [Aspergillus sclerotialis]|uniref:Uncharacterized protein n=1 Tax=Aspergillus sclerotialis TaxID=2070753 RepID=A0A3A2ZER9_9EURO|nr:hypothetical protein PHISCL_11198 [Aspergillus sclerotialis]